jgi:putative Mg2+ transporter-C (MgtC) family protein
MPGGGAAQPLRSSRDDVDHLAKAIRTHVLLMEKVQEEWTVSRSPFDAGLEPVPSPSAVPSAALDAKVAGDLRLLARLLLLQHQRRPLQTVRALDTLLCRALVEAIGTNTEAPRYVGCLSACAKKGATAYPPGGDRKRDADQRIAKGQGGRLKGSELRSPLMLSEWEVALRLVAGMVAGMIIGLDRARLGKGTGVRTLGLVGLGTAAATAIFDASGHEDAASRVVQGIVTGIGFLGAGVIVRRSGETFPRGLTTAASIWVAAALGSAAGAGVWTVVGTGGVLAFILLAVGPRIERLFGPGDADDEARESDGGQEDS